MDDNKKNDDSDLVKPGTVFNQGSPILLTGVSIHGVSGHAARASEKVQVITRLSLTSDDENFHIIVQNLASVIEYHAQLAGIHVSLNSARTVLLIIRPDDSAELWLDTAAVALQCIVKKNISPGTVVFESDIADVIGMNFPCVNIGRDDRVVCIFREGWRFALFFDFNSEKNLVLNDVSKFLGILYRHLKYRELYDAVADDAIFNQLVSLGWFPFVEIIGNEFKDLVNQSKAQFDLKDTEAALLLKFNKERLFNMQSRWMLNPAFVDKKEIFESAINSYLNQNYIAVIKILLTEIEGVLSSAYFSKHGKGAKIKELLAFAIETATNKAGHPNTLFLAEEFAKYLDKNTFANFDPIQDKGTAGSRHAVGHGAAPSESYTQVRALQAILTLDQLAFYLI